MSKIKKLTWFAFFCTITQYVREHRFLAYFFGTAFNCIIPGVLFYFYFNGHIGWLPFVGINALFRILMAPLDEYVSEEFSYSKLRFFPLRLEEKLYVRIISKSMQLSEWLFVFLLSWVYISSFPIKSAVPLIISTVVCIELAEELVFYIIYLIKNIKSYMVIYATLCVGAIGAMIYFRHSIHLDSLVVILINVVITVISIIIATFFCKSAHKHRIVAKSLKKKKTSIPVSTKITRKVITKSSLVRLMCHEFVCLFKLKPWNLISALVYCFVFSVLDRSGNYLYLLVQYFIVDFFFLSGFNYYGNIDDTDGLVLMSTVSKKDLIRSKNITLGSVALFFSTIVTLVLGVIYGNDIKELALTMFANVFCISIMILFSSVLSIKHFHLSDSKKKYTVQNMICMVVALIICSIIATLLFTSGSLAAIGLIFIVMMSCVCLFFSLIDVSMLEYLFNSNLSNMIYVLRNH